MSDYCEVCESVAEFTSSTPATDMITVLVSSALFSSSLTLGYSPVVVSSANFVSSLPYVDSYAVLSSTANFTSTATHSAALSNVVISGAEFSSSVVQSFSYTAIANAVFTSTVQSDTPVLVTSFADFSSTVTPQRVGGLTLTSSAAFTSALVLGLYEFHTSSAQFTSELTLLRNAAISLQSGASFTSEAFASSDVEMEVISSTANFTSSATSQVVATTIVIADAAFTSEVWFTDVLTKAWLMNTETSAVSHYDNFAFESIISINGTEFAAGPDGIYRLDGATDQGREIDAKVQSGLVDFGVGQVKRLDNMYFGYTSGGLLDLKVEVYDSGHTPATYTLEERPADAPRNSRVTPGKGLWGRYWRLTISNVDGADFEVHDASVDLAVSPRRI